MSDENLEWTLLGGDLPGELEPRGVSWVGSLWYTTREERLRLGLSGLLSTFSYHPGAEFDLGAGQTNVGYAIASIQYNTEDWTLTSEYSRLPLRWQDYGEFFPYRKSAGEGYYLQGAYRVRPGLELTLRYEEGFADREGRNGERASLLSGGAIPPFDFYAKVSTLGVRWDINRYVMVRADYQRHQGTYTLAIRENDPAALVRDWDLFALQIAVRF